MHLTVTIRYFYKPLLSLLFFLSAGSQVLLAQQEPARDLPAEKTVLFADKTFYLAGEIIWFTAHLSGSPASTRSKVAYVELLNNQGKAVLQAKILMSDNWGKGSFYLPLTLPTGVYTLLAYTASQQITGPETFFKKRIEIVNTLVRPVQGSDSVQTDQGTTAAETGEVADAAALLRIETNKETYSAREKIEINISPSTGLDKNQLIKGTLSVHYRPHEEVNRNGFTDFVVNASSESVRAGITPEYDGHVVTAKVISNWNQQPASGVNCVLSVPSAIPFGFYTGVSDSEGIVKFNIKGYFGNGQVLLKAFPDKNPSSYTFEIVSPFADSAHKPYFTGKIRLNDIDSAELIRRSIAMQAGNIYFQKELNNFSAPPVKDSFPFFGKAEYSYYLDDYKRFSTMEEVLREYVRNITVSLRNGKLRMSIVDEKNLRTYDDGILVMIDGVPITDYNNIFNYDPHKVKKLQVVPLLFLAGQHAFPGVVSLETYNATFDAFDIDNSVSVFEYDGFQLQRDFFSPSPKERDNLRIPDYRTTLLWTQGVDITANRKYSAEAFASDFSGTYLVQFQGILANGEPVRVEKTIEIKGK